MLGNMWIYMSKQINNSKFGKSKKIHTIHIINKQWVNTKKILKATQLTLHIKEILNKIMSEFFSSNQEIYAIRQWNDLLKVLITYGFELQSLVLSFFFFFFLKKFLWHLLWKSLVVMNFLYFCLFKNVLIFTLFLKGTLPDTVFSVDRYFVISTLSRSFHCHSI